MAQQLLNLVAVGDTLPGGGAEINANFTELYAGTLAAGVTVGNATTNPASTFLGTGTVTIGGPFVAPSLTASALGSAALPAFALGAGLGVYGPATGGVGISVGGTLRVTVEAAQTLIVGDVVITGRVVLSTVGAGISIKEGTNGRMGASTLVGGTVVVANNKVSAVSRIFLSRATPIGTLGHLSYSKINGTSFTILSTSGSEASSVVWEIKDHP